MPGGQGVFRLVAGFFLMVVLIFCLSACRDEIPQVKFSPEERQWLKENSGKIVLAEYDRFPPMEFLDQNGEWSGISSDYIKLIEQRLNFRFKRVPENDVAEILQKIRKDRIDLKCNFQQTPERSEFLLFTEPYIDIPHAIIVRKEVRGELRPEAMGGMRIAVVNKYAIQEHLRKNFPHLLLQPVENDLAGLRLVSFHQADAMIINLATASYLIETEGLTNLRLAGVAGKPNRLCLASRKDLPVLNRIMVKGLAVITDKEKKAIYRKWIRLDRSVFIYDKRFWYGTAVMMILVLAGILTVLFWNRTLKVQVAQKTSELQKELAERKKMERQLLQAEKMEAIGTFAGGIAHDFNNTLGSIIGYCELMEMLDIEKGSRAEKHLQKVLKAAYRAKGLVQQILTFSRKSGSRKLPVALTPIIKEAVDFIRASFPATVSIVQHYQTTDDVVYADPIQIHRLLMNLCANAAHAMEDNGGSLRIILSDCEPLPDAPDRIMDPLPGPYVSISVRDSGYGMAPEIIPHIFEPFFSTRKRGVGTGMGLSVVHGVVHDLGGTIQVASEPGRGSAFTIFMPKYQGVLPEASKAPRTAGAGAKASILFVDDESLLSELAEEALSHLGHSVTAISSSVEALEVFWQDSDRFDLVVTDLTMPELTGMELAEEIHTLRPHLPIILCSGFNPSSLTSDMKKAGVRRFVQKPLGAHELADIVIDELQQSEKYEADHGEGTDY